MAVLRYVPLLCSAGYERLSAHSLQGDPAASADFVSDDAAPTLVSLTDLASSSADLALLQALSSNEEDPAGLFSWNDINVNAFHAAASVLPMLAAVPPFAITATPSGFKTALLQYLTAQAAPGALLIDGGTLGITCVGADGLARLGAWIDRLGSSAWVARVLAAAPLARPLATLYTGGSGAAGKDGAVVRVFLPPGSLVV